MQTEVLEPPDLTLGLDAAQGAAVGHGEGPALVLAGPGSGKTRVIVERYCRLLESHRLDPGRVLLLTFADAAASEMRERIEQRSELTLGDHWVMTFHAFARRLLARSGRAAGIRPASRIPPAAVRWQVMEEVLRGLGPGILHSPIRPRQSIRDVLRIIQVAKREQVSPQEYESWAQARVAAGDPEGPLHLELARAYAGFVQRQRELGHVDFDDMLVDSVRMLEVSEPLLRQYREQFAFIMVDEFQDTDPVQARLVELLAGERANVMVVADDDQSIYKFRGASLANIRRFRRTYPQRAEILLGRNYRSTPAIVAAASAVIGAAEQRESKDLKADATQGLPVEVVQAPDERAEAQAVARRCRRLIEGGAHPAGIAVLVRRHAHMEPVLQALREAGVPYRVLGGHDFFRSRDIKGLMALLRAVADPDDPEALLTCLRLPCYDLSGAGRIGLVRARRECGGSLFDRLLDPPQTLDEADGAAVARLAEDLIALHQEIDLTGVRDLFHSVMERTGFAGALRYPGDVERLQATANLNKFADLIDIFCEHSNRPTLTAFLAFLELTIEAGDDDQVAEIDQRVSAVQVMTAHRSKGLEFDHVLIPGLVDGRFPSNERADRLQLPAELAREEEIPAGDTHTEEERRVLYVAMTRARRSLTLAWAHAYQGRRREQSHTSLLLPAAPLMEATVEAHERTAHNGVPILARLEPADLQLSFSRLRDFELCPRRYAYRHIHHLPERPSARVVMGQVLHRALEIAARRRLGGDEVDGERLSEMFGEAWLGQEGIDRVRWAELEPYGRELVRRYGQSAGWRDGAPSQVEQHVTIALGPYHIDGRIDRIDTCEGRPPVLVDYKSGRAPRRLSIEHEVQFTLYREAAVQRFGAEVRVEAHFLEDTSVVPFEPDQDLTRRRLAQAEIWSQNLLGAHRTRIFDPKPSAWNCRECPFRLVCDEGREITAGSTPVAPG